ncbi:bifunctional DNA primase/polymerase [Lentzea nigeriaca]|uniref:bifunctional DNA primase/polymerase n=1 Tax=Lentzea nigeriaca TaxID=1128665 RepID=UPI0019595C33|nr:bifunctional DNA primase/polymerase [Lentzea nigeriaca]MBM7861906.1 hypothetical protein [Lentzea nigeriaca]
MNESLLRAALDAVARGFHIFPLLRGGKKTALHGEKACPRTGPCADGHLTPERRSLTDVDQVRWYWTSRRFSGCNVGTATGPSGLVVIDLDTPKSADDQPPAAWALDGVQDGHDVFALVCERAGEPVPYDTLTVRTARGGTHLYFRAPAGVELRNTEGDSGNGLGWKVDTRAWGGHVVAPGSRTRDGVYRIEHDREPADLPGWLTAVLTPQPRLAVTSPITIAADKLSSYVDAAVNGECNRVAGAQDGLHDKRLFASAIALGQLVGSGDLKQATAEARLLQAATRMIEGPCDCTERKVRRTIENGLRIGANDPRRVKPAKPDDDQPLFGERGAA